MLKKRGQASTEALVIIGLAVVLVFALLYAVFPVIADFAAFSESAQAERSMSKIVGAMEAASAYGPGTETTLYVYLPAGEIKYVPGDYPALVFTLRDQTDIVRPLGISAVELSAPATFDAAGIKKVIVKKDLEKVHVTIS